jgi:UDP-GlcNAc:undecaprenyl-phosphate GlcNAc-1-phosphate transferase
VSALAALAALPVAAAAVFVGLRSPLVSRLAKAPRTDRWNDRPTPLLGGPAIMAGLLAAAGVGLATGALAPTRELGGIVGGCAAIFLVGLVDDVRGLPPLVKLGGQVGASAIVVASGLTVQVVSNGTVAAALAVLWLVAITNAFNLLDNIDGLASMLALIAAGYFALDAATQHPSHAALAVATALGLGCAAFLPFNLRRNRPAAVFLGDSGSHLLGFGLAALGLASSWKAAGTSVAAILLPILVLAIPILDTALVTLVRLLEGRPVYRGGRDHTSHRLVYLGLSEKRAVVLLGVVAAVAGGSSVAYQVLDNAFVTSAGVLLTFALLVQFGAYLADVERDPISRQTPFALRTRRLVEVLVDGALIAASFATAYLVVTGTTGTTYQKHLFLVALPVVLAARYLALILMGLYRGVWRYAGAREATAAVAAVVTSAAAAYVFVGIWQAWGDFHRSVFVVDALICIPLIVGSRLAERALFRALATIRGRSTRRRTLIVGAGRGGRSLLRELRETPGEHIVGFVDDDPLLRRRRLQGAPVIGTLDQIALALDAVRPDRVLVTIPDAPRERLNGVVDACTHAEIPCRFVRRETDIDPRAVLDVVTR